jgi:hypothetical protein
VHNCERVNVVYTKSGPYRATRAYADFRCGVVWCGVVWCVWCLCAFECSDRWHAQLLLFPWRRAGQSLRLQRRVFCGDPLVCVESVSHVTKFVFLVSTKFVFHTTLCRTSEDRKKAQELLQVLLKRLPWHASHVTNHKSLIVYHIAPRTWLKIVTKIQ